MSQNQFIESIPFSSGCEVARFDERAGIIAINKKAGRATHPNPRPSPSAKPPMLRAAYNFDGEYYSWTTEDGQKRRLYLANRLDSPTSGIVIAATNEVAAKAIKDAFKNRAVQKVYLAIVMNRGLPMRGAWRDRMAVARGANFVRASAGMGNQIAMCDYQVVSFDANKAGLSLLRLEPTTGFTHQLRIQCAKHNSPILGDATYGNFIFNKKIRALSKINRLFLHCCKTVFSVDINGEKVRFEVEIPAPESFSKIMSFNADIAKGML